ncbi:HAD hydrolase-like protein [bacterium]|nr:HAD hydrolase-like protein [bacterium]
MNSTKNTFSPNQLNMEIIKKDIDRGRIRYALFDFDGTLSLIREGWQNVMIPMMVEILLETDTNETKEELTQLVKEYVTRLTGKQTIYQMIELKAQVEKRGGKAREPVEYKHDYLARLWQRIQHRVDGLKNGSLNKRDFVVPGTYELLDALKEKNIVMYLASGTDLPCVQNEVDVLGLSNYFGSHIYAALDEYKKFSKKMIIEKMLKEEKLHGPELVAFGDGYVEIENTKEVDGIAIGVATDEVGKEHVDAWKRNRLIEAGADIIIPHYKKLEPLLDYLFV